MDSLSVSRAEVASSSKSILGFRTKALAMATLCFWPPLSWAPLSPTKVSNFYSVEKNKVVCQDMQLYHQFYYRWTYMVRYLPIPKWLAWMLGLAWSSLDADNAWVVLAMWRDWFWNRSNQLHRFSPKQWLQAVFGMENYGHCTQKDLILVIGKCFNTINMLLTLPSQQQSGGQGLLQRGFKFCFKHSWIGTKKCLFLVYWEILTSGRPMIKS